MGLDPLNYKFLFWKFERVIWSLLVTRNEGQCMWHGIFLNLTCDMWKNKWQRHAIIGVLKTNMLHGYPSVSTQSQFCHRYIIVNNILSLRLTLSQDGLPGHRWTFVHDYTGLPTCGGQNLGHHVVVCNIDYTGLPTCGGPKSGTPCSHV